MSHRKIVHVDMDAFYASVEQRDQPSLRGRPVIVGGNPHSRGVVAACSYEARKFGIHSAMASARAVRLCPDAIFVSPRFDVYRQVSQQIHEIFHQYTDLVEPLSLDEAYLDVTENKKGIVSGTWIAQEIRSAIKEQTQLTASAGVSYNKFLAKVASDVNKPDGLKVITPEEALAFLDRLPIRRFHGVGKVTETRMLDRGIKTGRDLRERSLEELERIFGKAGRYFYNIVRGIDHRPVKPDRERKSFSVERTFSSDCNRIEELHDILRTLTARLVASLNKRERSGFTLTVKVKYADFQSVTRSLTQRLPYEDEATILRDAFALLSKTEAGARPVRLLGVGVSNLHREPEEAPRQLLLPFPKP